MKTNRYIKIFIANIIIIAVISKIGPLFSKNISEHNLDRILLLYFLVFNIILFLKLKKEERNSDS